MANGYRIPGVKPGPAFPISVKANLVDSSENQGDGDNGANQVAFGADIDWQRLGRECSSLWVWSWDVPGPEELTRLQTVLGQSGRAWRCVERVPSIFVPDHPAVGFLHCRVYHWVRE